jgi:phosphoenolpyruvate carboxykinase (GTP)
MVKDGALIELKEDKYPNCHLHRCDPNDVARSEQATYICTKNNEDVGSMNNWMQL